MRISDWSSDVCSSDLAPRIAHWQAESIERLNGIIRALSAGLYRYDPQTLGIVDRKGFAFSEAAEFLGFLLSGTHRPVPITRLRFRDTMPSVRPIVVLTVYMWQLRASASSSAFSRIGRPV